jgi:Omp85 superfamily domain
MTDKDMPRSGRMRSLVRRELTCWTLLTWLAVANAPFPVLAEDQAAENKSEKEEASASPLSERSPWLLTPLVSSNPKLGTSAGALAGYIHLFDPKSRPSIFAVQAQYSTTDSLIGGVIARASFDEDKQRVLAGLMYGNIKNDYDDYLGSGVPLKNEAELRSFIARYTYRVWGNWFLGGQGIYQNFAIAGATPDDDLVLDILGIAPYKSAALGLVVQQDSRDNENKPTRGWLFTMNNMAFRESLGGENDYDVYRTDFRYFVPHGNGNVFALRQLSHFTNDAPQAAQAPVQLRGYKVGQYTGKNMSSLEVEERWRLAERWTTTIFAGIACLYGDGETCSDSKNTYPAYGAGIQYVLKPLQGIVANLEYAAGEGSNYGIYLKMGYAF